MKKLFAIAAAFFFLVVPARATVTSQTTSVSYSCTGSVGPYSFTFPISDPTALSVIENGLTLLSTSYTTTPVNNNYENGGSVTLNTACASGGTLVLQRFTPFTQQSIFTDNMPVPYKTMERGLDKLTEIDQELALRIGGFFGPTWTSGDGPPTGACVDGSIYIDTSAGATVVIYDCVASVWVAVAASGSSGTVTKRGNDRRWDGF